MNLKLTPEETSAEFPARFEQAQRFVGKTVVIEGGPSEMRPSRDAGVVLGVHRRHGLDHVDFELDDGTFYGLQLAFVSDKLCTGPTCTFSGFMRSVSIVN